MSDDFDFGDDFDDSFLREVDTLTAKATSSTNTLPSVQAARAPVRTVSAPLNSFNRGWTGPQRSISSSSACISARPGGLPPPPLQLRKATSTESAGAAGAKTSALSPREKGAQARRLALQALSANASSPASTRLAGHSGQGQASAPVGTGLGIPSSRLQRTSSGSGSTGLQTHLNFRKENQTTKGKRWDRTAFAASGRKIVARNEKALKAQQKRKAAVASRDQDDEGDEDMDEDEQDEDDGFGPLAPPPKARVDTSIPYEPPKHLPDMSTIKTYIYPTNRPKRDYQYEIVQACFADNCLVALPTGLGKTFVAGVVMLNFYRWFPTGKIVFLAPTKPLVNQQIEACQMTCGIPSKDAAVMTGSSVSAKERAKMWQERRVFYCTPQTMHNDLESGRLDPRDIVLAVFDEAHKASGSYAYTLILAYLTAHQPYFRVLALTATPGADVPKVQGVVDALHISRIEIREAEDPAISKYMNEKKTERHVVPMTDVIEGFRDRWAALMKPIVQKLVDKGVLTERDLDTKRLKPFRLTSRRMEIARDRTNGMMFALNALQSLERMARAMTHLLEFSIGMFHTTLLEIAGNTSPTSGKKSGSKGNSNSMRNNFEFQKLLRDVETEMNLIRIGAGGRGRSDAHPKMAKTVELLLAHFAQAAEDEEEHGMKNDTRAMVFCSFRDCVLEVVDMLNDHPDLLKATKFVGQSQGKQEKDKGFNQKEQKQTINDFKNGKYNILVSTSIGEEGLDIGEVDFVVIYDMPKQSIKLLQRIGRTGRKRSGQVHVLMSENREDLNWDSAQKTHREIQEEILHSRNLELFEDVERMLPVGLVPACEEREMPVDPWDPEDQKRKITLTGSPRRKIGGTKGSAGEAKMQRGDAIPEGASNGFKSVAELLREQGRLGEVEGKAKAKGKGKAKPATLALGEGDGPSARGRKRKAASPIRSESESDDIVEDEQLLYGKVESSTGGKTGKKPRNVAAGGKAKSAGPAGRRGRGTKGKAITEKADDSGEGESIVDNAKEKRNRLQLQREQREASTDRMALDFFNTLGPVRHRPLTPAETPPSSPLQPVTSNNARATHPPASPNTDESDPKAGMTTKTTQGRLSPHTARLAGFSQVDAVDLSWAASEDGDDEEEEGEIEAALPAVKTQEMRDLDEAETEARLLPSAPIRRIGLVKPKSASTALGPTKSTLAMPPPPVPNHRVSSPVTASTSVNDPAAQGHMTTPTFEPTQFPVRRPGANQRHRRVIMSSSERESGSAVNSVDVSSPLQPVGSVAVQRRRLADPDSSPVVLRRPRPGRSRAKAPRAQIEEYLDVDVEVSGSDDSGDEPSQDIESESDRQFAGKEFQPTQAPKGYNQRAMYMAGLSTQAGTRAGLGFKERGNKEAFLAKARKPVLLTDSEGEGGAGASDSENEYELGSFVVQDDEDLGFEGSENDSE